MSSPLSALPSSPLSTLSSPPVSPTASTDNKEVSVRSQHFSYDSPTPRRNGNHARRTKTTNQPYAATSNVGNNEPTVDDVLTSPSWDVNNNTNFFRVGAAQPQPQQQLEAEPIGRSRSFWDRFAGGGFTAAGAAAAAGGGGGRPERPKPKGGSFETNSRGHSSEEEDSLLEAGENDLFAQEVGLMFSTDDGDTIRDENLFAQSLSMSMSRGLSASFSRSFAMDSASHRTPSDRLRVLTQGLRRESNNRHEEVGRIDDDGVGNNNYLQNTKYAVGPGPQPPQLHQRTSPRNESEMSIHTSGQSTTLSNKIPSNAKMILGYKNARKHRTQAATTAGENQAFPLVTGDNPISADEMEKRLREIAGQLNADWREPSFMPPALARRLRDFQFARAKRTKRYGASRPWGILGLYDHLSGVKVDVEWAEDAAWRRQNDQPYQTWGDFEKAKNKGLNSPFFTHFTVSVCTAMMIASLQVNGWRFEPLAVNPMIGPSAETLLKLGAKDSYLIVDEMEVWRVASPMVLHAGLIHFFLNMFALWFVGRAIEQIHGFFPAVVQFVVPAIGGTILSAIFLPEYITVGASGGIFGLIGACISDIFMNWNLLFNQFVNEKGTRLSHARVLLVLAIDIVVNCLIGLTPFVDNFTHLGGMVYGFLCGLGTIQLVSPKFFQKDNANSPSCCSRSKRFFFRFFGVLISLAGIVVSSIVLMSGDGETNPCTSCTYMSCIAFPPWTSQDNKWWYCDDCARATATGTMENGVFASLNVTCPNGMHEVLKVEESWPQDELGLEGMLPMLCREHCLW
eukprot:scaffold4904_cov77-Skeletonema_marinoi.AAC.5